MTAFLLLFALNFTAIAAKSWEVAAALTLGSLPSYLIRFHLGPLPATVLELMIVLLAVFWLAAGGRQGRRAKFDRLKKLARANRLLVAAVAIFVAAAVISIFISPNKRAAWGELKAFVLEPLVFAAMLAGADANRDRLIRALGVGALIVAAFALVQRMFPVPLPPPWDAERRVTSFFEYPNAVGLFLGPIIVLAVSEIAVLITTVRKNLKSQISNLKIKENFLLFFWLITLITSSLAIFFAQSDGAMVGVLFGLIIFGLLAGKFWRRMTLAAAVVAAIIFITVPQIRTPLEQKIFLKDWSGTVRQITWKESWNMLADRPILGAGFSGYQLAFKPYHRATAIEIFKYPHNLFLNFWSETGLLGLLAFILIITLFFAHVFKTLRLKTIAKFQIPNSRFQIAGAGAAMVALLVHGLVDVPYFKNDLAVLFWFIVWLGVAAYQSLLETS